MRARERLAAGEAAHWHEADSIRFRELGDLFVPARELQLSIVAEHVPGGEGPFDVVDLGCGDGALSAAILRRWSSARVLGLDASPSMLAAALQRCAPWGDRFQVRAARLEDAASRGQGAIGRPRSVVSSLAVHHLDDGGKQQLLTVVAARLEPGGALLIADVVQPATTIAQVQAARLWDAAVVERCAAAGRPDALEIFRRERWNMFALPQPDPEDHPAPLADQLLWLRDAGFRQVDVFWAHAGHAVFGGRR